MILETLRYADEVQKAQGYFREIPDSEPDPELLDLAQTLIEKKARKFDPKGFHDRYVDALRNLIEKKKKAKGAKVIEEDPDKADSRGSNVVDLMAALKKSLGPGDTKPASKAKAAPKKAPAKKPAAKKRA
jgi:DNA end-binding protein Ku